MDLVVEIYKITAAFPPDERFGLTTQMRRSAVSIPSNIAEGSKRGGAKEFQQFLRTAYASGAELETQTEVAKRLGLGTDWSKVDTLLDEVMRMLNVLCNDALSPKNYKLQTTN